MKIPLIVEERDPKWCLLGQKSMARLIVVITGNSELISLVRKMRQQASVYLLTQVAALAALENPEYYEKLWKNIKHEKEKICHQLAVLDLEILPSATNFVLIRTPKARNIFPNALER